MDVAEFGPLSDTQRAELEGDEVDPFDGAGITLRFRPKDRLASRVITEALRTAATMGPPLALLFCHANRAGLYERHGFTEVAPPVLVRQPRGYAEIPQATMWRALRDGAVLPAGPLTVHSLPF